jgi:CRP-like cAMP-binding protein
MKGGTKMIDIGKLKDVDIFQGLRIHEIDEIIKLCDEVKYDQGAIIFREGEAAEFFYILENGSIDLRFEFPFKDSSKEMTIETVHQNGSFGWSAILEPHIFTLSAYCLKPCRAIRINGKKFLESCQRSPDMGVYVMRNLAKIISHRLIAHQERVKKEMGEYLITKW